MMNCLKCRKTFQGDQLKTLARCDHSFCGECLVKYLGKLNKPKMKCILPSCTKIISDKDIRECLSDDQIIVYEKISIEKSSKKATECLTKFCPFMFIQDDKNVVFECSFCGAPNCTKCKKRHYVNDCGRNTADEEAIESRTRDTLKNRKRAYLEKLTKEHILALNPDSFECPVCGDFFLPRTGIILRNCLHSVCKDCLISATNAKSFITNISCPYENCGVSLDFGEINALLEGDKLSTMMTKEASARFFQCKTEGCSGTWDVTNSNKGFIKCSVCNRNNCLSCKDIHDGMSCATFRKTKNYISPEQQKKMLDRNKNIKCYICYRDITQDGGCGALYCDNCGSNTCLFTGKMAGRHNPHTCYCKGAAGCTKIKDYCGCNSKTPCHKDCTYGCYPD